MFDVYKTKKKSFKISNKQTKNPHTVFNDKVRKSKLTEDIVRIGNYAC